MHMSIEVCSLLSNVCMIVSINIYIAENHIAILIDVYVCLRISYNHSFTVGVLAKSLRSF